MAKFKSSFFSDESYNYTPNVLERIYKDLKTNPTYVVARCEKVGEVNSPANIKLDTEADSTQKRNWQINEQSDVSKICEGYLDYQPESIMVYHVNMESPRELVETNYLTKEVVNYSF